MHIKILLTLTLVVVAKCSFAQDTTGGTRPGLVIPFHKSKANPATVTTTAGYPAGTTLPPAKKKTSKKKVKKVTG